MTIKAYLVGGAVRDRLIDPNANPKDLDYAVEAPSYEAMVEWIKEKGKIFLEQPQFWTVRAQLKDGKPADFVLCRKDGQYTDGRRPDSVTPGTILDDLSRRDFTVNAIAFDEESNEYIDPFGGKNDIKFKRLACVGNARDRFSEDYLRMIRALRFAITKDFKLSAAIDNALSDIGMCHQLGLRVSGDRIRDELRRCFAFDTLTTLWYLNRYPAIQGACFKNGLWLEPTQKDS